MIALPAQAETPSAIPDDQIAKNIEKFIIQTPEPEFVWTPKLEPDLKDLPVIQRSIKMSALTEQEAFNELVRRESGGDPLAVNPYSLACGLPQFLPCKKLLDKSNIIYNVANLTTISGVKTELAKIPYETQVELMWEYINARYQNARNALAFHNEHGWY